MALRLARLSVAHPARHSPAYHTRQKGPHLLSAWPLSVSQTTEHRHAVI